MTATTSHAQDKTIDPALRNTSRSLSGLFRDDCCCGNTGGTPKSLRGLFAAGEGRWPDADAPGPGVSAAKPRACPLYAGQPGSCPRTTASAALQTCAIRHPVGDLGATCVKCGQGGRGHEPHSHADRPLVHVENGLVDVEVLDRPRFPGAEPGQRTGYRLQIPREVLAAQALRARRDRL